ncbi:hypothetical protein [Streptomyces griseus]|uniref:hypothetical protein n=1 Tax=Streptomyces griseus TaxID=1911 RepID=UPI000AECFF4A|nr:hypothetical protein [Streptomyces griseus]
MADSPGLSPGPLRRGRRGRAGGRRTGPGRAGPGRAGHALRRAYGVAFGGGDEL